MAQGQTQLGCYDYVKSRTCRFVKLPIRISGRPSLHRRILVILCLALSANLLYSLAISFASFSKHTQTSQPQVLQPTPDIPQIGKNKKRHDPEKWLQEHSNMNHYETGYEWFNDRPKAALISLVRNEELDGILQSMRQLEWHWNKRYRYPWMFFSETPFTDEFKVHQHFLPSTYTPIFDSN